MHYDRGPVQGRTAVFSETTISDEGNSFVFELTIIERTRAGMAQMRAVQVPHSTQQTSMKIDSPM